LRDLSSRKYVVLALEESHPNTWKSDFLKRYERRKELVQLDEGAQKSVFLKLIPIEGACNKLPSKLRPIFPEIEHLPSPFNQFMCIVAGLFSAAHRRFGDNFLPGFQP